jgi:hypothetical protein
MIVTVDYFIARGPDLHGGSKFGETKLDRIRPWRIDAHCAPVERGSTTCQCQLTRVDIVVDCVVRLNPQKIARSFFDPDPANPRGYEGRRVNGQYVPESPDHYPLDEASVLLHEQSHCRDIADAVQSRVRQELEKVEATLIAQCPCKSEHLCHESLMNTIAQRIRALGVEAYEDLLADAETHKRESATERRARQTQIDDFQRRDQPDDDGG